MRLAALLLAAVSGGGLSACTSAEPGTPVPQTVEREPGDPTRKVLDKSSLETGVWTVLTGIYDIPRDQIESVDCPAGQEVKAGNSFTCAVRLKGRDQVVDITVRSDDNAEYSVGTPRDK